MLHRRYCMLHLIANPYSQSGHYQKSVEDFANQLSSHSIDHVLHLTEYPGHAQIIASELALSADDRLMIIGGDGSINDTINGLSLPCACPVYLLPAGTGNDFARGLKLNRDRNTLIRLLESERSNHQPLDLGQVRFFSTDGEITRKRFAVSCGMGFDAAVCGSLLNSPMKSLCNSVGLGKLSYVVHGIQELFKTSRKKRTGLKLVLDNSDPIILRNVAFISCHNTVYEGGGFPFSPMADPSDGLLSLCVVMVPNRLMMIPILLASLMGGKHIHMKSFVQTYEAASIKILSSKPVWLHTDGECLPDITAAEITVLPQVLPLVYESLPD